MKVVSIFNPEIIFSLVDEKPTEGVGYFMISSKGYLKWRQKNRNIKHRNPFLSVGLLRGKFDKQAAHNEHTEKIYLNISLLPNIANNYLLKYNVYGDDYEIKKSSC